MAQTVTIIGQGYVGLPLAKEAALAGLKVKGYDISGEVVDKLNTGLSHVDDISNDDVQAMLARGYSATTDPGVVSESDVVVICVPTPLAEGGAPDLSYIQAAVTSVAKNLRPGAVVVLESTTYPGTTEDVCLPLLLTHSGLSEDEIYVAFSPERVDPGRSDYGIRNTPKLVGGINETSTRKASEFYDQFIDTVVPMSGPKEAEMAKLLENTFRHVNIALVNELAMVCHELDIDIWEVIRGASTKPFGYMKFTPGPGVGGHCIPIDPNYLSYEVQRTLGYPLKFVELAQETNNSMPQYVVNRAAETLNQDKLAVNGSSVLLLGVTYKKNIADQRESPALPIGEELLARGAAVRYFDPYVPQWHLSGQSIKCEQDLATSVAAADLVILLQGHDKFDIEGISANAKRFLDTSGSVVDSTRRL